MKHVLAKTAFSLALTAGATRAAASTCKEDFESRRDRQRCEEQEEASMKTAGQATTPGWGELLKSLGVLGVMALGVTGVTLKLGDALTDKPDLKPPAPRQ